MVNTTNLQLEIFKNVADAGKSKLQSFQMVKTNRARDYRTNIPKNIFSEQHPTTRLATSGQFHFCIIVVVTNRRTFSLH